MKRIKKSVLSIITTLIIVMGMFSPVGIKTSVSEVEAANFEKTQQNAIDWCKSLIGTAGTDEDNAAGVQCVDLVRRYTKWLGKDLGPCQGGAAAGYGVQNIPTDYYDRFGNGTNPQPGDIFVWNKNAYGAGQYGHVGVIYAVDANYYYYIDYAPSRGNTPQARGPKGNTKKPLHDFNYIIRPHFKHIHNFPDSSGWVEKAPTMNSKGLWRFKCSSCGDTSLTREIPALGDANLKNGTYMIQSAISDNKYVSVAPYESKKQGNIGLYDKGVADQKFHVTKNGDGTYKIGYGSFVVDVCGGDACGNVWLWDDTGSDPQRWYIVNADDRGFRVVNKARFYNLDVAGGHPFEDCFGDDDLHRAGVTYVNTVFGDDEYYIGSTRISKDLARKLREHSRQVWRNYSASGKLVDYCREWKLILANQYGIDWNGVLGENKFQWGC